MKALIDRIRVIAEEAARSIGIEVCKVEYKLAGKYSKLQVVIHREGGTGIRDCEDVSRKIEQELDALAVIPGRYSLEVMSRGVDLP